MKTTTSISLIAAVLELSSVAAENSPSPPLKPPALSGAGPKIVFATPVHDFGRMKGGEVVNYTYVFTNAGDALLEVSGVQFSCGCTSAGDWSRRVEAGKTGSIPIQFNSGNFSGQVAKTVTVTSNDTNQPSVVLQFKANIWKPIEVTPQFAALHVTSESPSNATTVRIVSHEETPLVLSAPESNNRGIAAELTTNQPGKEFQLIVKTVPPLPVGNVSSVISLKTSSTNVPVINVTAWANVQPAIAVSPPQIGLPQRPLANPTPYTVSIRNNGTNTLALSEPAVNAKGVGVRLKEVQPGRYFTVTVSFPAGFEIASGETIELSVKSNHPQFPVIRVPIQQPPRSAPTAPTGGVEPPAPPPIARQPK